MKDGVIDFWEDDSLEHPLIEDDIISQRTLEYILRDFMPYIEYNKTKVSVKGNYVFIEVFVFGGGIFKTSFVKNENFENINSSYSKFDGLRDMILKVNSDFSVSYKSSLIIEDDSISKKVYKDVRLFSKNKIPPKDIQIEIAFRDFLFPRVFKEFCDMKYSLRDLKYVGVENDSLVYSIPQVVVFIKEGLDFPFSS